MFMVIYSFSPFVPTVLTPVKTFTNWFGETDFFSIVKGVCACSLSLSVVSNSLQHHRP